jgi:transketolase
MAIEPLAEKWKAFGWHAQTVDGNSIEELETALRAVREPRGRPKVIICYTTMGKGVPLIEEREKAHFVKVEHYEWELALAQLEGRRG